MKKIWQPNYKQTNSITNSLVRIGKLLALIEDTSLPAKIESKLKHDAKLRSTHYSTKIEGNRLSLKQTKDYIDENRASFKGRERDKKEIANYWEALTRVEEWASNQKPISEEVIKKVHALVEKGKRVKPTEYRTEQNKVSDSITGTIVYLPPEAKDVKHLMEEMVAWVNKSEKENLPCPIIAALLHYQFVTIHPYYDGNGRTARLLATYMLIKGGYGINGMYSLEEYHSNDISSYYKHVQAHPHHNYYMGRENADLTKWLSYFIGLLEEAFKDLREITKQYSGKVSVKESEIIKALDSRKKEIYALFETTNEITSSDIARVLKVQSRRAAYIAKEMVKDGFLVTSKGSTKARSYTLGRKYR